MKIIRSIAVASMLAGVVVTGSTEAANASVRHAPKATSVRHAPKATSVRHAPKAAKAPSSCTASCRQRIKSVKLPIFYLRF